MLAFLSGCAASATKVALPPSSQQKASSKAEAVVYLDGTMSMSGYVNFPTDTEYATSLKLIEQALTVGWKEYELQYFRYGDTVAPIKREQFLLAAEVPFYTDHEGKLQDVIASMDPEKINIVVTDLFQTDHDQQAIISALKSKFFSQGKSLAILGLNSRFDGDVYDIDAAGTKYFYKTEGPESFKPFYFLVMGPEQEVLHYTDNYCRILPESAVRKVLLFDKHLGGKLALSAPTGKNSSGQRTYAVTKSLLGGQTEYPQYLLKDHPGEILLDAKMTLPLALKLKELQVTLGGLEFWQNGKFVPVTSADFLKAKVLSFTLADQKLNGRISLQLDPGKLPQKGIYRMDLLLNRNMENYRQANTAMQDWNMDDAAANTWTSSNFPGNKTYHLNKFTDALSEVAYVSLQPSLGESWVYFKY